MANVRLNWVLPTTRESGGPLPLDQIKEVGVEISADGAAFAVVGAFPPNILETVVEALDTGTWTFRGRTIDTKGRPAKWTVKSIVVDESAPGELTLTLTLV